VQFEAARAKRFPGFHAPDSLSGQVWSAFGRPVENSFSVFGFRAQNMPALATEASRVDGSMPSLATTSNPMIRNGFWGSPADHPRPSMAVPRTIGKRVVRALSGPVPRDTSNELGVAGIRLFPRGCTPP